MNGIIRIKIRYPFSFVHWIELFDKDRIQNRPSYKEWLLTLQEGSDLLIIQRHKNQYNDIDPRTPLERYNTTIEMSHI